MVTRLPAVIVGGGQAGLSVSWYLKQAGIDHVVLERDTLMHNWADARWDSFCLVTPNFQCRLPGYSYDGSDPQGFMVKKEIQEFLTGFVTSFSPPVREGVQVTSVRAADGGGFTVETTSGTYLTEQVVVATGGYHTPSIPRLGERLPSAVEQIHSARYRNAESLPDGPVLVVGTGQSGAQIAEDLLLAGRDVHLAVGGAPRFARRYRGKDVITWLEETGYYDKPVTDKPVEERTKDKTNHYVTGRDGGRDIDLRAFATQGMSLHGRLREVSDESLHFGGDLEASLDHADEVYNGINAMIDEHIEGSDTHGVDVGEPSRYHPVWRPYGYRGSQLPVDGIAAVVWATGFVRDYRWLHVPVFDGAGHPQHVRGVSSVPGVYFIGLPWQHTWGSGRFAGLDRDAEHVAQRLSGSGVAQLAGSA